MKVGRLPMSIDAIWAILVPEKGERTFEGKGENGMK
jgi:hypothetical protein